MTNAFEEEIENLLQHVASLTNGVDQTKGLMWRLNRELPLVAANDRDAKKKPHTPSPDRDS